MRQELLGLDGVAAADVSYEQAAAHVRYHPEKVSPQQMVEAIDATGFTAELPNNVETSEDEPPVPQP